MKKLATLCLTTMLMCVIGTTAMAVAPTSVLDLTTGIAGGYAAADSASGSGWEWDKDAMTLTITESGLTIDTGDTHNNGLIVSAGTTIVLNGDLTITANGYGIAFCGEGASNITIKEGATLSIECERVAIKTDDADSDTCEAPLTIDNAGALTIEVSDIGIYMDGAFTHNGTGAMDIVAGGDACIYANDNITLDGTVNLTSVNPIYSGIYVEGDAVDENDTITITAAGDVTITATGAEGESGICIEAQEWVENLDIVINGALTLKDAGGETYSIGISAWDTVISITGTGTFTSDGYIHYNSIGTIDGDVNALFAHRSVESVDTVVYGNVTLTRELLGVWYEGDAIRFASGATLTIPADVTLDLNEDEYFVAGSIDTTGGALIVDGLLVYPAETVVDFTAITGTGAVIIGTTSYNTDREPVTVLMGDIVLSAETPEDGEGYTWILENGTYTLTFDEDVAVVNGDIMISVGDTVINVSENLTIMGGILTYGDQTITGDGTLIASGVGSAEGGSILTIDTTVNIIYGFEWVGVVVVNGDLTAGLGAAYGLTVNDGATVTLTGGNMDGVKMALMLLDANESSLHLGDGTAILTPADGGYAMVLGGIGTITVDGEVPALDGSNIATHVVIGPKPISTPSTPSTYASSVASTSNGDVSISSSKSTSGTKITITADPDNGYVVGDVTVTYASGRELKVTDNGNGTYSYLQPGAAVTVTVTFVDPDAVVEEETTTDQVSGFSDVDADAYYYDAMLWAVEKGITTGYSDDTFRPTTACTRGQVVTFLWRAAGEPEWDMCYPYADVDADAWYVDAVYWATVNGIATGYADETFRPDNTCTRGQIVTFLWRMAGCPVVEGTALSDVDPDAYYYDAVLWAVAEGITTGYDDGTFQADTICNRGQIVTFLYRYLG